MSPEAVAAYMGGMAMGRSDVPRMVADGITAAAIRATLRTVAPALPWTEEQAFHWGYATGAEQALDTMSRQAI